MIQITNFLPKYFEGVVGCYQEGFPRGHNRYTLSRLARWQSDTILIALDNTRVTGVLIGFTSYREAWITALTVLPSAQSFNKISLLLAEAMARRFTEIGFTEAKFTTARRSVLKLARLVNPCSIDTIPNCYYDDHARYLVTVNTASVPPLKLLLSR